MVEITKIIKENNYLIIEFLTNSITISTRVYNHESLTPQEIIESAYGVLRPHIDLECQRLNIIPDHELPTIEDEIISIRLLGLENFNFIEGQNPITKNFRCAGTTKFAKIIDLTDIAIFTPPNPIIINPIQTEVLTEVVQYNDLQDSFTYNVFYKSLAQLAEEQAAALQEQQEVEAEAAANELIRPLTLEEQIANLTAIIDTMLGGNG